MPENFPSSSRNSMGGHFGSEAARMTGFSSSHFLSSFVNSSSVLTVLSSGETAIHFLSISFFVPKAVQDGRYFEIGIRLDELINNHSDFLIVALDVSGSF